MVVKVYAPQKKAVEDDKSLLFSRHIFLWKSNNVHPYLTRQRPREFRGHLRDCSQICICATLLQSPEPWYKVTTILTFLTLGLQCPMSCFPLACRWHIELSSSGDLTVKEIPFAQVMPVLIINVICGPQTKFRYLSFCLKATINSLHDCIESWEGSKEKELS